MHTQLDGKPFSPCCKIREGRGHHDLVHNAFKRINDVSIKRQHVSDWPVHVKNSTLTEKENYAYSK